jgi:SAM-dependent methyltransferase
VTALQDLPGGHLDLTLDAEVAAYRSFLAGENPLPSAVVACADEMYGFNLHALRGSKPAAGLLYFLQGYQIAEAVAAVARWRFGSEAAVGTLLDFASGFGRGTRWLVTRFGATRVTAVEIDPLAVVFQQQVLGVEGLISPALPEDLAIAARFDLVVAASFFSHLPARRFEPWLARLVALLNPGGVLLLSTHGPSLLESADADWSAGIVFRADSETTRLEHAEYGTSYVTEGFVRQSVARVCGGQTLVHARPFGLCAHQDLYVIVPALAAASAPLELPLFPRGELERLDVSEDRVELEGWVECAGETGPDVRLVVGGSVVQTSSGGPGNRHCWRLGFQRSAVDLDTVVRVEAESQRGLTNILSMGTLRPHVAAR